MNPAIETLNVQVEAMTFGRNAIARVDGKVVMIPGAVPGDLVDIEIVSELRHYVLARIVRIVQAGAARRDPPCHYASSCGGCDWQQMRYESQIHHKSAMLAAEFHHALGIQLDPDGLVEASPAEFGYRSRVRLKTGPHGQIGFTRPSSNALVTIDTCLVGAPKLDPAANLARALGRQCREIELVAGECGEVLIADLAKAPARFEIAQALRMIEGATAGIVLRCGSAREVVGNARVTFEVEPGCVIEADADLFSQVNRAQNLKLVAAVMKSAQISPGTRLLDLFCGAGNFSLPSARRGSDVTGADANPLAIEAARANACRMGFRNAQFMAMRAAEAVRFLSGAAYHPEVIILDPPRTGATDLIDVLVRLQGQKIIYASCDPSTLMRDLVLLTAKGYRITQVRAFDFFPNTHHLEIVVTALLT